MESVNAWTPVGRKVTLGLLLTAHTRPVPDRESQTAKLLEDTGEDLTL